LSDAEREHLQQQKGKSSIPLAKALALVRDDQAVLAYHDSAPLRTALTPTYVFRASSGSSTVHHLRRFH
jgi:hypothetical protein